MARDVEDVGTNQRFTPRDHQQTALVHFRDLIDETETFIRGQFVAPAARFCGGVEIAVVAFEVATLRQVECDKIGLEIVDGSSVVRTRLVDDGLKNCVTCCWMAPNAPASDGVLRIGSDLPIFS
jgi:hypothetical protein